MFAYASVSLFVHLCVASKILIFSNKLTAFLEGHECTKLIHLQGSPYTCTRYKKDLFNMPIKEQPAYLAIIFISLQVLNQDLIKSEQASSAATSAAPSLWLYLLPVFDYLK